MRNRMRSNIFSSIDKPELAAAPAESRGLRLLESTYFQLLSLVMTFYTLFFDDFQQLFCRIQTDSLFDAVSLAALALFLAELGLASCALRGYVNSYYFYLDIISALSILIDLNAIKSRMADTG
jgi:hypothetical protein